MPRTGVIVMEMMVPMPLSVMVGAVLGPIVEAFLMGPFMPTVDPIMEPFVPRVIAGMSVIVIMSQAGRRWNAQNQDGGHQ